MNSFVVILSCFAALAIVNPAQIRISPFCFPNNCPPAVRNPECGPPNCTISGNQHVLHPTCNPNWYYQCHQQADHGWTHIIMPCACETLFVTAKNRCEHPEDWEPECQCQIGFDPDLDMSDEFCVEKCPDVCCDPDDEECSDGVGGTPPTEDPITTTTVNNGTPTTTTGGNGPTTTTTGGNGPTTTTPSSSEPTTTEDEGSVGTPGPESTTTPLPENCQCPCVPCIWWPCMPCLMNCGCQNLQQPQQPQMPWQPQSPWLQPNRPW